MEKQKLTLRLCKNTAARIKQVLNDPSITPHIDLTYEMQELHSGTVNVTLTFKNPADLFFLGVYCYR